MTKPAKLSKGERTLLIGVAIFAMLLLGIIYWRYTLEINPLISLTAPPVVLPHPNAQDYYVKASEMIGTLQATVGGQSCTYGIDELEPFCQVNGQTVVKLPTTASQPAPTWEIAEAFVKAQAPAFATLHQGFTLDCYTDHTPDGLKFRRLARVLALAGRVNAHHGDWAAATEADLDAVQLGEEMQHGGSMFTCIIGRAYEAIGRPGAWTSIPHLNGAQARAAARRMETLIARARPYADMLQQQKYVTLGWMNACFHKPWWRKEVSAMQPRRYSVFEMWQISSYSKRAVLQHFIHAMDMALADAKQPYSARSVPQFDPRNPLDRISALALGYFTDFRFSQSCTDTQNALLLLSYALQAYHAEHGRYPGKLSELSPAYVKAIPNDPFAANKPFCYKLTGTHYLLYSIGPDGIDNGGTASSDGQQNSKALKAQPMLNCSSTGDIVAGVNVR